MKTELTNIDEIFAAYEEALADWRGGNLDEARRKTGHIRKFVAGFPKLSLLEAFIARDSSISCAAVSMTKSNAKSETRDSRRKPGA